MNRVPEGGSIDVRRGQTFVVERRALEGSGYRTEIVASDGIVHVGTVRARSDAFGGAPIVEERFRCESCGPKRIEFVTRRPWQSAASSVVTRISCTGT